MIIGLLLHSQHLNHERLYANETPGIYAEADSAYTDFSCRPSGGIYRNSLGNTSVFGGCTFGDQLRVTVGAVSGYAHNPVPLVIPSYSVGIFLREKLTIGFIPYTHLNRSNVVTFSVEREF